MADTSCPPHNRMQGRAPTPCLAHKVGEALGKGLLGVPAVAVLPQLHLGHCRHEMGVSDCEHGKKTRSAGGGSSSDTN